MRMATIVKALLLAAGMATAARAEPIELKFAVSTPPQVHYNVKALIPWAKKVTAESGGTLRVKMFFGGVLGREGQFIDVVQSGAADIAMDIISYYPGRFPQTDVTYLPSLIGYDTVKASNALWAMYHEGFFNHDFAGLKVLALSTPTAAMIMTTKKPVTVPADMVGLKIGAGGKVKAAIMEATGGAMINLEAFNMYQPLSRGMVDGVITHFTGIAPFKLNEVGKYYTKVPLGGSLMTVFMSQARFDALPEAAKKAIADNSGAVLSAALGKVWQDAHEQGIALAKSSGGTIIEPDAAQLELWNKTLQPVTNAWLKGGDDRQKIYDALKAKLAQ